jgi:4-amino-4-deoxy-L-arabinose transferase-like glycosyltransferase
MTPQLWRWYLALLLTPIIVLWRQDNSLYTGAGYIDPWLYYGFFRNLAEFKGTLFFGTYYGSRLSWLLPGWAAHSVLPPLMASAVLHLLVHSIATVSFFTVLRRIAGLRAAFLTALVFSLHPWLWAATGWDYLDGAGIAYCLLSFAFLTTAVHHRKPVWLFLAGVALSATIYTNLFLIVLAPLPVLYYFALAHLETETPLRKSLPGFALWAGAGFLTVTVLLGAVNVVLDGHFWFYAPSVLAAMRLLADRNPWLGTVWTDHGLASYLWIAVVALFASVAALTEWRRGLSVRLILAAQFLIALLLLVVLQLRGTPTLSLSYYASYLLPFAFLAIGAIFFQSIDTLTERAYLGLCGGTMAVGAIVWGDYSARFLPAWPTAHVLVAIVCAAVLAAAYLLRNRGVGAGLALAGLFILTAEVRIVYQDPHLHRMGEERLGFNRSLVEAERKTQPAKFWYNESDPAASADARALVSTYIGMASLLGTAFPADKCNDTVEPGTLVGILSSAPDVANTARRALAECWTPLGMQPEPAGADRIRGRPAPYMFLRFRAAVAPGARAAFEVPTPERWLAEKDAEAKSSGGQVDLRTPSAGYGLALVSPAFDAPVDGRYRFALRYRAGAGHIAFGVLDSDDRTWLERDVEERRLGGEHELSVWVELDAGDRVRLAVANCHWASRPSSAIITKVEAVRVSQ